MKNSGFYIFVFQIVFFAVTTFVVHLLFFEFWILPNASATFRNWLPVLIFDLVAGLAIGFLNGLPWWIFGKKGLTSNVFILTDIVWLVFCYWWYFNNKPSINREAAGHLISPFICGFAGLILAGLSFGYFSYRQRKFQEIVETN